jgi:hypothetical protein
VLIVPFEKLFPRHQQRLRRPQVATDMGYALSGTVMNFIALVAAIPVGILSLGWLPGLLIRPLVSMIPATETSPSPIALPRFGRSSYLGSDENRSLAQNKSVDVVVEQPGVPVGRRLLGVRERGISR